MLPSRCTTRRPSSPPDNSRSCSESCTGSGSSCRRRSIPSRDTGPPSRRKTARRAASSHSVRARRVSVRSRRHTHTRAASESREYKKRRIFRSSPLNYALFIDGGSALCVIIARDSPLRCRSSAIPRDIAYHSASKSKFTPRWLARIDTRACALFARRQVARRNPARNSGPTQSARIKQ